MEDFKGIIAGGIIVVLIGGTTFAVNQTEVLENFGQESGMSQQQAEEFSQGLEDASFTEVGNDFLTYSQESRSQADSIDCVNYVYEWEDLGISCQDGKSQLMTTSTNERLLGECYLDLDKDLGSGTTQRMNECIQYIDTVNTSYDYAINSFIYGENGLDEMKNINIYNKSVLLSAKPE